MPEVLALSSGDPNRSFGARRFFRRDDVEI
jgi:hypothetical protein